MKGKIILLSTSVLILVMLAIIAAYTPFVNVDFRDMKNMSAPINYNDMPLFVTVIYGYNMTFIVTTEGNMTISINSTISIDNVYNIIPVNSTQYVYIYTIRLGLYSPIYMAKVNVYNFDLVSNFSFARPHFHGEAYIGDATNIVVKFYACDADCGPHCQVKPADIRGKYAFATFPRLEGVCSWVLNCYVEVSFLNTLTGNVVQKVVSPSQRLIVH